VLAAPAFTSAPTTAGAHTVTPHASASATTTATAFLCTSTKPSVGFRLRGELTGSRLALPPGTARAIRPCDPKAAPVPPLAPLGSGATRRQDARRSIKRNSCKLHDLLQNGAVDEIAPQIWHWKAVHPNLGIEATSYWLPDLRLLLDPIAGPDEGGGGGDNPPL